VHNGGIFTRWKKALLKSPIWQKALNLPKGYIWWTAKEFVAFMEGWKKPCYRDYSSDFISRDISFSHWKNEFEWCYRTRTGFIGPSQCRCSTMLSILCCFGLDGFVHKLVAQAGNFITIRWTVEASSQKCGWYSSGSWLRFFYDGKLYKHYSDLQLAALHFSTLIGALAARGIWTSFLINNLPLNNFDFLHTAPM